jgi:hypothetical protein
MMVMMRGMGIDVRRSVGVAVRQCDGGRADTSYGI